MNREIKFRIWDKIANKWIYVILDSRGIFIDGGEGNRKRGLLINFPKDRTFGNNWYQYTGHKDKNGKYIYDGDIMQTIMKPEEIKVIWRIFWGRANTHNENIYAWCAETERDSYWLDDSLQEQGEVIGNIYENPDLLK